MHRFLLGLEARVTILGTERAAKIRRELVFVELRIVSRPLRPVVMNFVEPKQVGTPIMLNGGMALTVLVRPLWHRWYFEQEEQVSANIATVSAMFVLITRRKVLASYGGSPWPF